MEPHPAAKVPRRVQRRVLVAIMVAALFILLPAATAQQATFETVEVRMAPELFEATLLGEVYEGQRATDLRREIDGDHGDGDGEVTEDEVDAWVAAKIQEFNTQFDRFGRMLTGNIQVNGRGPTQIQVTDIRLTENVVGDVDDDTTVVRDVDAALDFIGTTQDRANITFAQDFRQAFAGMLEWDRASFTGASPWAVDPDTIDPETVRETFWDGAAFVVPYDETDTFASGFDPLNFQIHNTTAVEPEDDDAEDSPAIGTALLIVGLMFLAGASRRR